MTGKEVIIYILQNDLVNEEVFENGIFVGFMTEEEAAVKRGVGVETMRILCSIGALDGFKIGDKLYFRKI